MFILRALRSKNYRLFFIGQSLSLIGVWVARVATSWLVYRMTKSAFLLGTVGFVGQIPTFLLVSFAGVLADRVNRQKILFITQSLFFAQSAVLAFLTLTHRIAIWHILVLSFVQGAINAFDIPARQSFLIEMIEHKKDLNNAIALNASMFNLARLIGPAVAGFLIASVGEGLCFLIDSVSYCAVISSLIAMRVPTLKKEIPKNSMWQDLKQGIAYALGFVPIRSLLLLVGWSSLVGMSYMVLMPIFAKEVLHGGPKTLGFLTAASGLGALIGALYLASRKSVIGLERQIVLAAFLAGGGLVFFSLSDILPTSLLLILLVSFGIMVQLAASNTVLQSIVDDDKRGRVMSLYTMAVLGMAPFGSLIVGSLAGHVGAGLVVKWGGFAYMTAAILFAWNLPGIRKMIHPIYVKKGMVPEIASGIQTVTELTSPKE